MLGNYIGHRGQRSFLKGISMAKKKVKKREKVTKAKSGKSGLMLTSVIFCNSVSKGESGKTDCRGLFTSFLTWAYPTAFRTWFAILTAYNLPPGKISMSVSISRGRGKKTTLTSADIESVGEDVGNIVNIPLRYKFQNEGFHTVHFTVIGTTTVLKIPVNVITQPWPKLSNKQLAFLKMNPSIPHSIRMNIVCSECSRPYVFEENVLSNENFVRGVLPFPDSGILECENCGHKLHLKDIQGQLRSSIKKAVSTAMRGGK
jgi:hypothetical protein